MNQKNDILFSKALPQSRIGKLVQFPLIRIVIAVLFLLPVTGINNLLAAYVTEPLPTVYYLIFNTILTIICFWLYLIAYRLFARYIEKREAYELSKNGSILESAAGFLIGLILVVSVVGLCLFLHYYKVESLNSWTILINALVIFGMGAFLQELLFRGILFRIIEQYLGSWFTILIVALLFGIMHIGNENASAGSTISLIITNVLLSAAFIYTRRIWLVWGLHFGWNFFQDGIFGMANSGISELPSLFNSSMNGPAWITGGDFGIESSVISLVLIVGLGLFILFKARERGMIVKPKWKRIVK